MGEWNIVFPCCSIVINDYLLPEFILKILVITCCHNIWRASLKLLDQRSESHLIIFIVHRVKHRYRHLQPIDILIILKIAIEPVVEPHLCKQHKEHHQGNAHPDDVQNRNKSAAHNVFKCHVYNGL